MFADWIRLSRPDRNSRNRYRACGAGLLPSVVLSIGVRRIGKAECRHHSGMDGGCRYSDALMFQIARCAGILNKNLLMCITC